MYSLLTKTKAKYKKYFRYNVLTFMKFDDFVIESISWLESIVNLKYGKGGKHVYKNSEVA